MKYFILNSSGNYESLFLLSKQLVSWQLFYVCLFRLNLTFGDFLCHFSVSLSLIFDGGCGGGGHVIVVARCTAQLATRTY